MNKGFFSLCTALTLVVFCCLVITAGCDKSRSGQPGTLADDFRLETLSHERFYLNQQRGKVVLLVFWTTWCTQCKKELNELKNLINEMPGNSFVVGAVCSDPENINDLKRIASDWNMNYPVLLDQNAALFKKYRLRGFPSTMVIGRDGRIEMVRNGYSRLIMKQIRGKIKDLVSQKR